MGDGSRTRGPAWLETTAWLASPVIPALLADFYLRAVGFFRGTGDPETWSWLLWVVIVGPLIGYAFLAGATLDFPDPSDLTRHPRHWLSRRAVWVLVCPWAGLLPAAVLLWTGELVERNIGAVDGIIPEAARPALDWFLISSLVLMLAYGWTWPACAALRRAHRSGRARRAFVRGLAAALAFVGSLFGGFWAMTRAWRDFFFDSRPWPVVLACVTIGLMSGCASPMTQGDVRRRDLFQSMMMAWVIGLALLWRWGARQRASR